MDKKRFTRWKGGPTEIAHQSWQDVRWRKRWSSRNNTTLSIPHLFISCALAFREGDHWKIWGGKAMPSLLILQT